MGITATQTQRENKATWTRSGVTEHCEGPGGDLIELPCPNLKGVTSPYMLHREKPVQSLWKPIWHLARLEFHTLQPSHSTPRHSYTQEKFLCRHHRRRGNILCYSLLSQLENGHIVAKGIILQQ